VTDHTVYGFNDWYYAYGHNTPARPFWRMLISFSETRDEARPIAPYCVIDDGWQTKGKS